MADEAEDVATNEKPAATEQVGVSSTPHEADRDGERPCRNEPANFFRTAYLGSYLTLDCGHHRYGPKG